MVAVGKEVSKKKGKEKEKGKASSSSPSLLGCLHVVTGPNSGGKSTYLRAIGLAVVLSQALAAANHLGVKVLKRTPSTQPQPTSQPRPPLTMPDGRPYLITERRV